MLKKKILAISISLLLAWALSAQKTYRMIPFTGINYLRVQIDTAFTKPGAVYKIQIKSLKDNSTLWKGEVNYSKAHNTETPTVNFTVKNLTPVLWEPQNPHLYEVTLQRYEKNLIKEEIKERAGFRSFERKGGNLYLNGRPIFLRGIAINPPNRGIPTSLEQSRAFAWDYITFMKSLNVNIIRIPDAEEWYDVCDELGMMVFGGNYGGKVASGVKVEQAVKVSDEVDGGFPTNYDVGVQWYENDKLGPIAHHPSLMIYAMTNETPFVGQRAVAWEAFLSYAFEKLKKWDETRVYIANAGYGYGKTGDICDLHRYWGWYYSSPYTFLHIRNNADIIPFPKKGQPITFTECVGNYTGPDGRYNLTPGHKNPSAQLAWTGHAPQNLQAQLADEHQKFTVRNATEVFRQFRSINPDLSGVFPFTILFYNWNDITHFRDMKPKPITDQIKKSFQPILLSWESWTPNIYSGTTIKPIAHIINDDNNFNDITKVKLIYTLRDKANKNVLCDTIHIPDIAYYGTFKKQLSIPIPQHLITGYYTLEGEVFSEDKKVSANNIEFFIANTDYVKTVTPIRKPIVLYDPSGNTKKAFDKLHITYNTITNLSNIQPSAILVIGEQGADKSLAMEASHIRNFISNGGRMLVLGQDSIHRNNVNQILEYKLTNRNIDIDNPVYPVSAISPRNGYYVNPERPENPIFTGITRKELRVWSDYTGWNASQPGMPAIYPVTNGFGLENHDAIKHTAILANYSSGLQAIAIAEQFMGKGSLLLSGLDISNRVGLDPIADRIMLNMLSYMTTESGHHPYQLITAPIIWGDYDTEKGIVTDLYSGFLVNSTPRLTESMQTSIVVTPEGYQLAGGKRDGFNSRPGIQYVANGRRPWGPYTQTFGGQPKINPGAPSYGTGKFWCRIPEDLNICTSVVWNPSKDPLEIRIKINNLDEVTKTINPGKTEWIRCPVNQPEVSITYMGDRRLVVLQTSFEKQ